MGVSGADSGAEDTGWELPEAPEPVVSDWCAPGEEPTWQLTDVAPWAGVQHHWSRGRGITTADLNGDGWPDLYEANDNDVNRLYINQQDGRFAVQQPGPELAVMTTSVSAADYDEDGDLDLWLGCGGFSMLCPNGLFRNDGNDAEGFPVWTEVTVAAGMGTERPAATFGGSWFDYDNDGDLDLFVVNKDLRKTWFDGYPSPEPGDWGDIPEPPEPDWDSEEYTSADVLWRNEGDGSFTDVSEASGLGGEHNSHQAAIADFDLDGDLDVYIPTFFDRNQLYLNDGDGTFTEDTPFELQWPNASFAAQAQDFDGDGLVDILVAAHYDEAMEHIFELDAVYLNQGDGSWVEATEEMELNAVRAEGEATPEVEYAGAVMGNQAGDLDGDGLMEMMYGDGGPGYEHHRVNRLWTVRMEEGGPVFRSRREHVDDRPQWFGPGEQPWTYPFRSHGTGFFDYDRDGDMDLFVSNGGLFADQREPNQLFRNDQSCRMGFVRVILEGTRSNIHGVGARVQLSDGPAGSETWRHTVNHDLASGFNSSKEALVTVGAGSDPGPYTLTVHWPGGDTEVHEGVARGSEVRVVEGEGLTVEATW